MEISLGCRVKVDDVPHRLGRTDADVERINDGLSEIFFHGCASQAAQIHAMEALLVPGIRK